MPDAILKKTQDLTRDEFEAVKFHTVYGAQFFENPTSEWDTLAYEVCPESPREVGRHGYPGVVQDIHDKALKFGPGKEGRQPSRCPRRIVTLADVYDALICKRAYKDAWEEDRVLFYIKEHAGRQFDPELVSLFFDIYDIIRAIREKWA